MHDFYAAQDRTRTNLPPGIETAADAAEQAYARGQTLARHVLEDYERWREELQERRDAQHQQGRVLGSVHDDEEGEDGEEDDDLLNETQADVGADAEAQAYAEAEAEAELETEAQAQAQAAAAAAAAAEAEADEYATALQHEAIRRGILLANIIQPPRGDREVVDLDQEPEPEPQPNGTTPTDWLAGPPAPTPAFARARARLQQQRQQHQNMGPGGPRFQPYHVPPHPPDPRQRQGQRQGQGQGQLRRWLDPVAASEEVDGYADAVNSFDAGPGEGPEQAYEDEGEEYPENEDFAEEYAEDENEDYAEQYVDDEVNVNDYGNLGGGLRGVGGLPWERERQRQRQDEGVDGNEDEVVEDADADAYGEEA